MGRVGFTDNSVETCDINDFSLDKLIDIYYSQNNELKELEKNVKTKNTRIKELLSDILEYDNGTHKAKLVVSEREILLESKMIDVLKKFKVEDIVKTREYVDTVALEKYLYDNELSQELVSALEDCYEVKKVESLRVTKSKKRKGGDL